MAMSREKVIRKAEERDDLCGKNLSGLDLSGLTFSQMDFSEANMRGVNLRHCQITQCEFNRVSFEGSALDGTQFYQCEFEDGVLQNVSAQGAHFKQCEFPGGTKRALAGATFVDCTFDGANDESTAGPAGLSAWAQYLAKFPDWNDPERQYQAAEAVLQNVGAHVEQPQVFRRPNDNRVELRGNYRGYPARVELARDDGCVTMSVMAPQPMQVMQSLAEFFYEPSYVPEPNMSWHQGELVRVFLGKGVFVRGISGILGGIEQTLPLLAQLPDDYLPELVATMTHEDIQALDVSVQEARVHMRLQMHVMYDPVLCLSRAIHLGARTMHAFQTVAASVSQQQAPAGGLVIRCRFCNAIYLLSDTPECRHCGAPAS